MVLRWPERINWSVWLGAVTSCGSPDPRLVQLDRGINQRGENVQYLIATLGSFVCSVSNWASSVLRVSRIFFPAALFKSP